MLPLYPEIRPFDRQWLNVSGGHRLYVEQAGTAGTIPVVVVHGGPGAGFSEQLRRFFDPEHFHIILYDQRGAGRSEPHAELHQNDSQQLVEDMERLRQHLGLENWVLFGGSWGATLSLLYAQAYPHRCLALILRGVFLARQQDVDWLYGGGSGRYFPEEWARFIEPVAGLTGPALIDAYADLLNGSNDLARVSAAKTWARWGTVNGSLRPSQQSLDYFTSTHVALSLARIGCHYIRHQFFIEPDQLLLQADRLAGIPGYIVHGRYDMVCPPDQAWQLAQLWPDAELDMVREGGHSGFDVAMVDALIHATQNVAQRFGQGDEEA